MVFCTGDVCNFRAYFLNGELNKITEAKSCKLSGPAPEFPVLSGALEGYAFRPESNVMLCCLLGKISFSPGEGCANVRSSDTTHADMMIR